MCFAVLLDCGMPLVCVCTRASSKALTWWTGGGRSWWGDGVDDVDDSFGHGLRDSTRHGNDVRILSWRSCFFFRFCFRYWNCWLFSKDEG
ncbi:hypothetical protein BC567DRAFT_238592 [Phyllosticta citribraziliensis]